MTKSQNLGRLFDSSISFMLLAYLLLLVPGLVVAQETVDRDLLFGSRKCPPDGFDAVDSIDFESFISARWYSIKQKEVSYQPKSQFNCVYAEYTLIERFCLFCFGRPRINVFNRALRDSAQGSENSINLRAIIPFPRRQPAKAFVGFRFFPLGLIPRTNYWIVALGTYDDILAGKDSTGTDYDWAIITAGKPKKEGSGGTCYSRGGMWIFARDSVPPVGVVDAIEAKALNLGLDITQWLHVEQASCDYS